MNIDRNPKLTQAVWHPTGTFVLTGHEDSSLVVWDAREGRVVMARTLTETNIDQPGGVQPEAGKFIPKTPLLKLAWCAQPDPDETGILIAGGTSTAMPTKGMSFFELGRTPNYATSSWKVLSNHFEDPKRQSILPTPPNVEVVNFCLIPQKSPWFAGAQDPIAILALLSSGEITTMSFPSGFPISPTNQLHLSMTLVHPFVNAVGYSLVERKRWLGLTESRPSGPKILTGGAEAPRPLKRFEDRSIMQTAHADGTIRLWDAGHADEIENENVLQADVCNAVGRQDEVMITNVSFSGAGGELAAGLHSGEVVIFRWLKNRQPGQEPPPLGTKHPGEVTDISNRRDPGLVEGFHPFTLLNEQNGPVTALSVSDVGFIAAAFKGGGLAVIDMRGPAIIFKGSVNEFSHSQRGGNFHKKNASAAKQPGFATSLEFSVMTLDEDGYSSILLHAGTNAGAVSTLKILPGQGGRYSVAYTGTASLEGPVVSLCPLSASSGRPANATQQAVAGLRNGTQVDGVLLAVTRSEARIFRPPAAKGAHKSWDGIPCESAAVTRCLDLGMALVCLFGDGSARSFSLPGLREIGSINLSGLLDLKRLSDAAITGSGDIIAWTGPAEMALLNVWGTGDNQLKSKDKIFNAEHLLPPRPTISNFQWVSGTQFITPADMDILIGGPNRPPSKRQIQTDHATAAAARAESRAASRTNRPQNPYASGSRQGDDSAVEDEGYWAYMQRQVTERTEKLGFASESTEKARSNSSGFADDVNKFVSKQKRGLVTGLVKSKFGL
ncbi:MAG: hypothetical protein M1831_006797 [Alyxoria varia]|nr:MAG: hypothetical protein M1831_006797 [Alyxoria varia]